MKKGIALLLCIIILFTIPSGCTSTEKMTGDLQENISGEEQEIIMKESVTEELKEETYYLQELKEEFDRIDTLTREEAKSELSKYLNQGENAKIFGSIFHILDLQERGIIKEDESNMEKEALKGYLMAKHYGLTYLFPSAYTGVVIGELYAEDLAYFESSKDPITEKLIDRPLAERKNLLYRNHHDFLEEDKMEELMYNWISSFVYLTRFMKEYMHQEDPRLFIIPELFEINILGEFQVKGVLVNKWSEETSEDLKEKLGDMIGDYMYYKHFITITYVTSGDTLSVTNFSIDTSEEYVTKIGPVAYPRKPPMLAVYYRNKYKDVFDSD